MMRLFGVSCVPIRCLSGIAWLAAALAPVMAYGQEGQPSTTGGAQPSYPGLPRTGEKVETEIGPVKARFYGTILFNSSISDSANIGQEVPLWPPPDGGAVTYPDGSAGRNGNNHDLIFTMRQSILGLTLNPARPSTSGWNPSALVEIDFFGSRTSDNFLPENRVFNQPRLRMGYFQLEHESWKIVFGQDKMILAPLDPVSLSHVGVPLGATAGDLWGWFPQVRVDWSHKIGNTGVLVQAGILRPQFGDPRVDTAATPGAGSVLDGTSTGLGERSSQPFYQARVAISPKIGSRTATFGFSGHFGEEKIGVNRNLQSWTAAVDMRLPLGPHAIVRGEAYAGSNLIPFMGGIDVGAVVLGTLGTTAARIQRVGDGGGWAELIVPMNSGKDTLYFGAGTDDPKNHNLLPGPGGSTRAKNSVLWASYFRKLTNEVTLAAEWSYWDFRTIAFANNNPAREVKSGTGTANVVNISLAYQF
jgi:hypothetical protein